MDYLQMTIIAIGLHRAGTKLGEDFRRFIIEYIKQPKACGEQWLVSEIQKDFPVEYGIALDEMNDH
jgi:hypothetical protein